MNMLAPDFKRHLRLWYYRYEPYVNLSVFTLLVCAVGLALAWQNAQ